ncbi:MAG: type I phosphomannose isomerase catalytic subunit [Terriglobales bacterium]
MNRTPLYPLRFEPIYQYRLWGGRRLADFLAAPLPSGPIGEAWLLSDREGRFRRFPLLLKFLDAREMLSVQVHPSDRNTGLLLAGETGKTEAWVVLEAETESRIYAGLKPRIDQETLRRAVADGTVTDCLNYFTPKVGDAVFLPAGTVHSLGGNLVVFEVQQNSDVTFRMYDWDHLDPKTEQPRTLQVDQALACVDFSQHADGPVSPVLETTTPVKREKLFDCGKFRLWRLCGQSPFSVGQAGSPHVLICIGGAGQIEDGGANYTVEKGDAWLLPAAVGVCAFRPKSAVSLLEIAVPD